MSPATPLVLLLATLFGTINEGPCEKDALLWINGVSALNGGRIVSLGLRNACVYDAATSSWRRSANLSEARQRGTVTALDDGSIITVGGEDPGRMGILNYEPLTSVERLPPDGSAWARDSDLQREHVGHSATHLQDDRVVIVGGSFRGDAELYDPLLRRWDVISTRVSVAGGHTATVLPSGDILIVGGQVASWDGAYDGPSLTPTAAAGLLSISESFLRRALDRSRGDSVTALLDVVLDEFSNEARGTYKELSPLTNARHHHTATLAPDGRVFVAGGLSEIGPEGSPNGIMKPAPLRSVEVYDPASATFRQGPSMQRSRYLHGAASLRTGIVVVGGITGEHGSGIATSSVEFMPWTAKRWSQLRALRAPCGPCSIAPLPGGRLLVLGERNGPEIYDLSMARERGSR